RGSAPASSSHTSYRVGQSPARKTLFRYTPFPPADGVCPPSAVPLAIASAAEVHVGDSAVPPPDTVLEWTSTSFVPAAFTTWIPSDRCGARLHVPPGAGGAAPSTWLLVTRENAFSA